MNLVLASANRNKIREIGAILPANFHLIGLQDIGIHYEIPEPGLTIKENSFLKAAHVAEVLKKQGRTEFVFADDSGMEVEALEGAPGVFSAMYAGIPKNDTANTNKLLGALRYVENRRAQFITIITLLVNGQAHYFEGSVKGVIAQEPKGDQGFGYDPVFIPEGYTHTFGELSDDVKNSISHRAKAIHLLIDFLKQ